MGNKKLQPGIITTKNRIQGWHYGRAVLLRPTFKEPLVECFLFFVIVLTLRNT